MKKMYLTLSALLVVSFSALTYLAKARHGDFGGSFAGSFLGGTTGSILGSAMTSKGSSGSDDRAMRAVERLEDVTRRDFQAIENRLATLEDRIRALEAQ